MPGLGQITAPRRFCFFRLAGERLTGRTFDLAQGFATLGDTLLRDIGGSMGSLYGTVFTEMAEALEGVDHILAVVTDVMPLSE